MTSGNFRYTVAITVAVIGMLMAAFMLAILKTTWVITPVILGVSIISAAVYLVRYTERANRSFTDFLLSIKNSDFTTYAPTDSRGRSFSGLNQAFNAINAEIQTARVKQESQYTLLQMAINNIRTAVVAFDTNGNTVLMNEYARSLLEIPFLTNVHDLQKINPQLYQYITAATNGIATVTVHTRQLKLLFRTTSFVLQGIKHQLVLMTDIKPEIDRKEAEAWEELLQVLTHEIRNSITPIASLSATISSNLEQIADIHANDLLSVADMAEGLRVIEKRSMGLVSFVDNYKRMLSLPAPRLERVPIAALFDRLRLLTGPDMKNRNITLQVDPGSKLLFIRADEHMLEQALLNLINNAADALDGATDPRIELSAAVQDEQTLVRIADNGTGIQPDILSKVFVPFFTTKNTGTGIGLSLTRQIMRLHGGQVQVQSAPGSGTVFTLAFPL